MFFRYFEWLHFKFFFDYFLYAYTHAHNETCICKKWPTVAIVRVCIRPFLSFIHPGMLSFLMHILLRKWYRLIKRKNGYTNNILNIWVIQNYLLYRHQIVLGFLLAQTRVAKSFKWNSFSTHKLSHS